MSPRKLSDANKKEILNLYRNSEETTSTLAVRYGVSSSTISRFLKTNLTEEEYEELIQQKRLGRTPGKNAKFALNTVKELEEPKSELFDNQITTQIEPEDFEESVPLELETATPTPVLEEEIAFVKEEKISLSETERIDQVNVLTLEEMLGEDLSDLDEDDEDLEETEEEDWELEIETRYSPAPTKAVSVKVLPLSEASFPNTCYLVIDRAAELITRPLKEFAELGKIPVEEVQQKTLPVFDNHRVARRFSHRSQRVIKIPDCRILEKTCSHLKAKGITRLLIDGQVYSLTSFDLDN